MKRRDPIHLGFEIGTGEPVAVPRHHWVVSGLTQRAGKTTALTALIARSGARALAFRTKRGEAGLEGSLHVPYFAEPTTERWKFVASLLETSLGEKLKMHRSFIMELSQGTTTLSQVHANVQRARGKAKGGFAQSILTELDFYLRAVVPQIEQMTFAPKIHLAPGVNVMDLEGMTREMQALVLRSAMEWVYEHEDNVITVVPEAWKFVGMTGSPVKDAAESLIREGAGIGNYVALDSQDIAGIDTTIRKQMGVWILGCQPEINEAKRTLDHLPIPKTGKPKPDEVQRLGLGQFYVATEGGVRKVYVQPAWMTDDEARAIAMERLLPGQTFVSTARQVGKSRDLAPGAIRAGAVPEPAVADQITLLGTGMRIERTHGTAAPGGIGARDFIEEDPAMCQEHQRLAAEVATLTDKIERLQGDRDDAEAHTRSLEGTLLKATAQCQKLEAELAQVGHLADAAKSMARALAPFMAPMLSVNGETGAVAPVVDKEAIVAEVLRRIPSGNGGGVVTLLAPDALKKQFQQAAADRIIASIRALKPMTREALKWMIAVDKRVTQAQICEGLGKTRGGWIKEHVDELKATELLDVAKDGGHGVHLRKKIEADLQPYRASEAEVEAVYQHALHAVASE